MYVCVCVWAHTHTHIYIYTHASIHPSMHTYISLQSHDVASTSPRDPPWVQGLRGHGKTQKTRNKCATLSRVPRVPRAFRAGTSLTVQIMVQWAWSNAYDGDWTDHGGVVFHEEWGTWWPGGKEDGWLNVSGWWKRSFCLGKITLLIGYEITMVFASKNWMRLQYYPFGNVIDTFMMGWFWSKGLYSQDSQVAHGIVWLRQLWMFHISFCRSDWGSSSWQPSSTVVLGCLGMNPGFAVVEACRWKLLKRPSSFLPPRWGFPAVSGEMAPEKVVPKAPAYEAWEANIFSWSTVMIAIVHGISGRFWWKGNHKKNNDPEPIFTQLLLKSCQIRHSTILAMKAGVVP